MDANLIIIEENGNWNILENRKFIKSFDTFDEADELVKKLSSDFDEQEIAAARAAEWDAVLGGDFIQTFIESAFKVAGDKVIRKFQEKIGIKIEKEPSLLDIVKSDDKDKMKDVLDDLKDFPKKFGKGKYQQGLTKYFSLKAPLRLMLAEREDELGDMTAGEIRFYSIGYNVINIICSKVMGAMMEKGMKLISTVKSYKGPKLYAGIGMILASQPFALTIWEDLKEGFNKFGDDISGITLSNAKEKVGNFKLSEYLNLTKDNLLEIPKDTIENALDTYDILSNLRGHQKMYFVSEIKGEEIIFESGIDAPGMLKGMALQIPGMADQTKSWVNGALEKVGVENLHTLVKKTEFMDTEFKGINKVIGNLEGINGYIENVAVFVK